MRQSLFLLKSNIAISVSIALCIILLSIAYGLFNCAYPICGCIIYCLALCVLLYPVACLLKYASEKCMVLTSIFAFLVPLGASVLPFALVYIIDCLGLPSIAGSIWTFLFQIIFAVINTFAAICIIDAIADLNSGSDARQMIRIANVILTVAFFLVFFCENFCSKTDADVGADFLAVGELSLVLGFSSVVIGLAQALADLYKTYNDRQKPNT